MSPRKSKAAGPISEVSPVLEKPRRYYRALGTGEIASIALPKLAVRIYVLHSPHVMRLAPCDGNRHGIAKKDAYILGLLYENLIWLMLFVESRSEQMKCGVDYMVQIDRFSCLEQRALAISFAF